jgi:hypothetical protein
MFSESIVIKWYSVAGWLITYRNVNLITKNKVLGSRGAFLKQRNRRFCRRKCLRSNKPLKPAETKLKSPYWFKPSGEVLGDNPSHPSLDSWVPHYVKEWFRLYGRSTMQRKRSCGGASVDGRFRSSPGRSRVRGAKKRVPCCNNPTGSDIFWRGGVAYTSRHAADLYLVNSPIAALFASFGGSSSTSNLSKSGFERERSTLRPSSLKRVGLPTCPGCAYCSRTRMQLYQGVVFDNPDPGFMHKTVYEIVC